MSHRSAYRHSVIVSVKKKTMRTIAKELSLSTSNNCLGMAVVEMVAPGLLDGRLGRRLGQAYKIWALRKILNLAPMLPALAIGSETRSIPVEERCRCQGLARITSRVWK